MNQFRRPKFFPAIFSFAVLAACGQSGLKPRVSNVCGGSAGSDVLDGLTWIAGSPVQANVLCQVKQSEGTLVQALDPESRDPLLFFDEENSIQLLVERFSGRQSRQSRVSWFSMSGERIGQRGDWPQNVYGINMLSNESAVVSGFDYGVFQKVSRKAGTFAAPEGAEFALSSEAQVRPVHLLTSKSWIAAIDNGYDLISYRPEEVKIYVVGNAQGAERRDAAPVKDIQTGVSCKNAFQAHALTRSRVLLSCNPQYFGPSEGQTVAVFDVSLSPDGSVSAKELVHFDSAEVQRIDIFGSDRDNTFVFLGYKATSKDNYSGKLMRAGWLGLSGGDWIPEDRFSGPLAHLAEGRGSVVACQADSGQCQSGQFLHLSGSSLRQKDISLRAVSMSAEIPFLSFAQEIKKQ